jgi:cation diffusion facilitator CzcD-associated flavoprotein CzcO
LSRTRLLAGYEARGWRAGTTCTIRRVTNRDAAVIGAGPAGLAVAAMLRKRGVDAVVIDRAAAVGSSWRGHYDRLHLHTVRWLSDLPGLRFPRSHGRWVHRDGVVEYLERYAEHHRLDLMLDTEVRGLARGAGGAGWVVDTSRGPVSAGSVVVATGYNNTPFMPDYPGRDGFTGELVHASRYRNAEPYRGRDVLVVGSGNTGAEIAVDLVEGGARRVRLAVRTPPNIVRREVGGTPNQVVSVILRRMPVRFVDAFVRVAQRLTIGDLSAHGLPKPERGVYTRVVEDDVIPIIDVGLIDCVKKGQVEIVGALLGFEGDEVILSGRERIRPEAVVVATGYRRGLEPLVGSLGVLGANGKPLVHGGRSHPDAPGLYFTGYTNPISGMFRELKIDARRIARAIARGRRRRGAADTPEPSPAAAA